MTERAVDASTVLVVGRTDRGKTTWVRTWIDHWTSRGETVGWVDADVGQGVLGPPTVQSVAVCRPGRDPRVAARWFVGSTSPRAHMLPCVVGVLRLAARAREEGCGRVVVDTTGLVAPSEGGVALKTWKAEALAPCTVVGLEVDGELEPILGPMEGDPRFQVVRVPPGRGVRCRSFEERAAARAQRFREHLAGGREVLLPRETPVYGTGAVAPGRLAGLLDEGGFCVGLGVMTRWGERQAVYTPVDLGRVCVVRLGALKVDPESGREG